MADQAINALSTKTAPETSDQLLLVGTGEPQLIDYDKLADAILNKITSKNYALDAGQMTLLAALNKLNSDSVLWKDVIYPDHANALEKIDTPSLLFGTGRTRPYIIMFNDRIGSSLFGGGFTVIFGYMYSMDDYGVQIAIYYSGTVRKRHKLAGTWQEWTIIHY